MFRPRVIPILLLKGNGLVKTVKFKSPNYIGDPINAVKIFNDFCTDELIFLDINARKENREPNIDLIKDIAEEAYMPFAVGGGINSLETATKLFKAGADKIVLNTASIVNPKLITQIADVYGTQSIVVSIDVKKNLFGIKKVYINSGTKNTKINPVQHAINVQNYGAGEILINSISHEGTMDKMDFDLIDAVAKAVDIPVIGSGGAKNIHDLKELYHKTEAIAVASGSAFVYQGNAKGILINYPKRDELLNLFKKGV